MSRPIDTSRDILIFGDWEECALKVLSAFRITEKKGEEILGQVLCAVKKWGNYATELGISKGEQDRKSGAFRLA